MGRPKTGKIVNRGTNTWRIYYELGDDPVTGKRRQKTETFHGTKEAARERWRKEQVRIDAGQVTAHQSGGTVGELVQRWFADYVPTANLRPATVAHYRHYAERYIVPTLGRMRLVRVTPLDIQHALATWLAQPVPPDGTLSPITVGKIHRLLRALLDQAVTWDLLDHNPARRVRAPAPGDQYRPQIWDAAAIRVFLRVAHDHRWGAGIRLALFAGLRRGEVLGLRWEDIDWETGTLTLRHTRVYVQGQGDIDSTPKTRSGWRRVVLDAESVAWLRRRRAMAQAEAEAAGPLYHDQGYVLQSAVGSPVGTRNLNNAFKRLCQQAGVPRIRIQDLRHTHGTALHEAGVDLKTIQDRLGHSAIGVTARYYLHPGLAPQAAAMDELLKRWNGDEGPEKGPK